MKTRKSWSGWIGVAFLLCGLLALVGLFAVRGTSAHAASPAYVRIIHASPFVGTADVFLDGSPLLTSFGFGAVTGYASVPEGPHKVQIAVTGKGIGAAALTQTLAVQPGNVYTVAAIGTSPQNLKLLVFNDNNIVSVGTAKVRVYQLSPDAGSITVLNADKSVWDGNYQEASEYFTLSAGTTTFSLDSSDYNQDLSITPALKANTVTSIFAIGLFAGAPKAKVVQAQVEAVPGLPQTGSDPFAFIDNGQLSTPWLFIAIATLFVGMTLLTRRWFRAH